MKIGFIGVPAACILPAACAPPERHLYQFKFDHPGAYKYICAIHPKMMATVIVK